MRDTTHSSEAGKESAVVCRRWWMATFALVVLNLAALGAQNLAAEPSKCPEKVQTCNADVTQSCSIPGYSLCNICWPKLFNPSQGTCISYN